ncbi:4-hydroxythreonine-4-phosphate dehydrogenase PdxA [Salipaludibacillus agaradhaerens]|uniref:4-hydroxythreonine-4-phosphate dehydrogenase PdxA n=1 Tax=Salipaludibacillus agaradhaerens TaxID=76935 RepID=A0A9Q4B4Y8_SALAG|nr:4-hydroxythreonine-4-phosphate dehydrogenase PdxA [Salipaludibacillus agaradhaerens]MCR6098240.1 4-hydroxythreonine-4-phosphate dehydrogenase PdxA [Salipaludibacillus agaradhaerens]MCR6116130.1 4-hydroxythreonine-4-phosphate dehydrogenase PdxA [Salipaludibacillus agaradhaerens]
MKPIIAVTMGDCTGVGPEIICKAFRDEAIYERCRPFVIGDEKILQRELQLLEIDLKINTIGDVDDAHFQYGSIDCIDLDLLPADLPYGRVSGDAGNAAFRYLEKAIELAKTFKIHGVSTAPLNKEALHKGGHIYPGHTEILAELTNTKTYSMMLSSPKLKVIHLTTHLGLLDAIESITEERTYQVIRLADTALRKAGYTSPKIAVCGINPHAGENGLFGHGEEEEKLVPGITKAQQEGISVSGPYPADTLFYRAVKGDFDIVVACYHDQGHVPIKVLGLEEGVNITVGLRGGVIRTSVDHGTAFDIAGKQKADARSMIEALKIAAEMAPKELGSCIE